MASALFFTSAIAVSFGLATALVLTFGLALTMWLGSLAKLHIVEQINNILLAFLGNTFGVWRAYRGEPVVTWDLANSARNNMPSNQPSR